SEDNILHINEHTTFNGDNFLLWKHPLVISLIIITTIFFLSVSNNVGAADACKYLNQYMAPFNPPIDNWPVNIAGPAPGDVEQRLVGPEECSVISEKIIKNAHGIPYRQVTIAISGTVFGFAPVNSLVLPPLGTGAEGEGQEHFFSDHAFIWQARGIMGPFIPGVATYKYSKLTPASVEVLIPENAKDWNGMMWVLVHGGGRFPALQFHPRKPNQFNRYDETSESAGALIDQGYAVIWTRRDAATSVDTSIDVANTAKLDNGMEVGGPGVPGMALNENLGLMRDYTVISRNYVEEQLGRKPEAIFFRGHSAGGAMGRSFLVVRGMNTDHSGEKLFDGFYLNDSAGGRGATAYFWESELVDEHGSFRLKPTDIDTLNFDEDQTRFMTPVVEVNHALYSGGRTSTVPRIFERVPATYNQYKRENARINIEKGLGNMWKSYEIAGVSHSDAAAEAFKYPELAKDMVDIGGVGNALEQALVDWVTKGKKPPDTRVDAADVWELDANSGPAIQLPYTACPRGIFQTYMNRPDGTSVGSSPALFVPYLTQPRPQINEDQPRPPGYKEEWLEPLNRKGYLVDMTGSGHRMTRPTIEQIWHVRYKAGLKTGVLQPYERLSRDRYVECVAGVVEDLYADGLLTVEAKTWYVENAKTEEIGVK
ncbi:MAG: hypothetical protein ACI909_004193, partial [Planctomycetota bacterium]